MIISGWSQKFTDELRERTQSHRMKPSQVPERCTKIGLNVKYVRRLQEYRVTPKSISKLVTQKVCPTLVTAAVKH